MLSSGQLPYIVAGMFLMTLQPILVKLSQDDTNKIVYSAVSATLLTELLKLGISSTLFILEGKGRPSEWNMRDAIRYAIPAIIYFVNNNLVFKILDRVDAPTFQLLSQLKIVFTGVLFRICLGRKLNAFQYLAIWQLACGAAVSQIQIKCNNSDERSSLLGLLLSVVSCMLSALGGIYSEKLLKEKPVGGFHFQNIQLYLWGILFNLLGTRLSNGSTLDRSSDSLFKGFGFWAYLVVINNALNGLVISAILKYADNIARVYSHSAAMLLTMVISVLFFKREPTPQLFLAIVIVTASGLQYNIKIEQVVDQLALQATDSEMKRQSGKRSPGHLHVAVDEK